MSILAHAQHDETLIQKVLHPLTGLDHIAAIAFVALSILLVVVSLRGKKAATTAGTVTRVRSKLLLATSYALLATSIVALVAV